MSAGARFTTIRRAGTSRCEFFTAAPTPSLASCSLASASPAMAKAGSPDETSTSTSTGTASTPTSAALCTLASISIGVSEAGFGFAGTALREREVSLILSRGRSLSMFPSVSRAVGRAAALAVTILLLASLTAAAAPSGRPLQGRSAGRQGCEEQTTTTMEFVLPDRFRMVIRSGSDATEITNIGPDQWIKSGSTCAKSPVKAPVANPREYIEHSSDTTITVTKGGRETVEGTATQTYMLVVEKRGSPTIQQKFHVAVGTGYPRRIEMQTSRGPLTIDYFDFDAAIRIDPPC